MASSVVVDVEGLVVEAVTVAVLAGSKDKTSEDVRLVGADDEEAEPDGDAEDEAGGVEDETTDDAETAPAV